MVDYGNAPFLWIVDAQDQGGIGGNICDGTGCNPPNLSQVTPCKPDLDAALLNFSDVAVCD